MNLITFGFNEKGAPVFLNQEPYPQVGTMYLMKAGDNSVIGITLDDKVFNLAKVPTVAKPRKAKAETAATEPKKRGRKLKTEVAEAGPKKRGRKPGAPKTEKTEKTEDTV